MKPAIYATVMTTLVVLLSAVVVILIRLMPPVWIGNALVAFGGLLGLVASWRLFYAIGKSGQ